MGRLGYFCAVFSMGQSVRVRDKPCPASRRTWLDLEFSDRNLNAISQVLREAGQGLSLTRTDCPMLKTAQK